MTRMRALTSRMEPFDSFWEGPENVDKGYNSFYLFYKNNYLKYIPNKKEMRILVISCGPGYFVNLLVKEGYTNVTGIDSFEEKVAHARRHGLNCLTADAFEYLESAQQPFDLIICEQELNHLTKDEILDFLNLCWDKLDDAGMLIAHSLNGANPITGAEALAQNFDHHNSLTEYSLQQVLEHCHFTDIKVFPLNLYVFYRNPINYLLIVLSALYTAFFRFSFLLYGKKNRIFTKKIGAAARKASKPPASFGS